MQKRGDGDYVVCCGHGDRQMEDVSVPREDVELYALDWVTFEARVRNGSIAYRRPSTAEEREADPVAAKAFLQETARNIAENTGIRKPSLIADYILCGVKTGVYTLVLATRNGESADAYAVARATRHVQVVIG